MYTIGFELAIAGPHKVLVTDEQGNEVTPVLSVSPTVASLDRLLQQIPGQPDPQLLQVVMEPTGMAWFPIAVYFSKRHSIVYVVDTQQVADLRAFYAKHAKSDRIDVRVLVRLPLVNKEQLHALALPPSATLACQRGCRELERVMSDIVATKNRLQATDRTMWPGLVPGVFPHHDGAAVRWFRQHWYDPRQVVAAGTAALQAHWQSCAVAGADAGAWVEALVICAEQVLALYGGDDGAVDFGDLQEEVRRDQDHLVYLEAWHHSVQIKTVRPLYRQIHPSRNLETLKGVGQDGAAVFASFIADPTRFPSGAQFRGWTGMVPASKQSGDSEAKGLHITKAGPDLIKKFAYLDAETARQRDPQIAALYYDQMVRKGKTHTQAVCVCATHLLDRVFSVLREDRPYELRDVDGRVVSADEACIIIAERYHVPAAVRAQRTKGARRARRDRYAEKAVRESATRQ
jgi:transposase